MSRRTKSDTEARIFTEKFLHYYRERWASKGRSGRQFLKAVAKAHYDRTGYLPEPQDSLLQSWKNGAYPQIYFEDIAKVLDIDPSLLSLAGDPEYDPKARNELDKVRFDFADKIGLNRNFMLFLLSVFSGAEFALIREYDYLNDALQNEPEFEDKSIFSLTEEPAKKMLCRFKETFSMDGVEILSNIYQLPSKKDLLYMKMLQDKYTQFLKIEVSQLTAAILAKAKPEQELDHARQWIEDLKDYQKRLNIQRDLEHLPKLPLWECVDPIKTPIKAQGKKAISATLKKLGVDPNQIN